MAQERISQHNQPMVEEFRSNAGRIGGPFEGHTILLLHNRGRRTGVDNVNPLAHLPDAEDPATVYVLASAAGRPEHPQWYRNLVAAGDGEVEIGTERFRVEVVEITGAERDRIYALQVERMPGFGMSVACKVAGQYPYSHCVGPADRQVCSSAVAEH